MKRHIIQSLTSQLKTVQEILEKTYQTIRSHSRIVPADHGSAASSRYSNTSLNRAQLAAQAASLRTQIEARKLEAARHVELARPEAEKMARRKLWR